MKRKVWNVETTSNGKKVGHWVRVTPIGVRFSKDLSEALRLDKTKVNFIQDEDRPADWYLELVKDGDAWEPIKVKTRNAGTYFINSKHLSSAIIQSCGLSGRSFRMTVAPEKNADGLYPIITKSAKQ